MALASVEGGKRGNRSRGTRWVRASCAVEQEILWRKAGQLAAGGTEDPPKAKSVLWESKVSMAMAGRSSEAASSWVSPREDSYQRQRLPHGAMQEKQGQTGTETAEADHAVAGERAGRARLERLRGVFAEKQPLGLGGEKLPDIEEIDAAARNAGSEGRERKEDPPMRRMESR